MVHLNDGGMNINIPLFHKNLKFLVYLSSELCNYVAYIRGLQVRRRGILVIKTRPFLISAAPGSHFAQFLWTLNSNIFIWFWLWRSQFRTYQDCPAVVECAKFFPGMILVVCVRSGSIGKLNDRFVWITCKQTASYTSMKYSVDIFAVS